MERKRPMKDIEAAEGLAETILADGDTEGHSMLTYELGLTLEHERRRQADRASRNAGWSAMRKRRISIQGLRDRWTAATTGIRSAGRGLAEASRRWAALAGGGLSIGLGAS